MKNILMYALFISISVLFSSCYKQVAILQQEDYNGHTYAVVGEKVSKDKIYIYVIDKTTNDTIISKNRNYRLIMLWSDTINNFAYFHVETKDSLKGACDIKGNEIIHPTYHKHLLYNTETGFYYIDSTSENTEYHHYLYIDINGNPIQQSQIQNNITN